uniref:Conserved oligomeric Golgi complex subunit 2 n=1 Tax=Tetradesmus obliquus TaxID=3088 RepID=A0A383VAV9_TETOB|eukprot:jgi/Sobl393_1/3669/SZX62341.1
MPPPSEGGQQQQQLQHAGSAAVQGIKSPMWLTPERFDDLEFSPDVCVADLRLYVPLPTVKAELQAYLLQLKNKLVEAINEDYSDYVGLSSKLGGLEGAVVRMRQPLLDIQGKLTAVQDAIKAELQALQQGLQRRQDAAAARAKLELMQEAAASTGKVEKLLEEVAAAAAAAGLQQQQQQQQQQGAGGQQPAASASDGGGEAAAAAASEELDAQCRLLEHVSGEAARLLYLVERGKVREVAAAQQEACCQGGSFRSRLQCSTPAMLKRQESGVLVTGGAQQGGGSGLVSPLIKQVVAEVRQQQLASGGGGSSSTAPGGPLAAVVAASLSRLQEAAGPLLDALAAPGSGLGGL